VYLLPLWERQEGRRLKKKESSMPQLDVVTFFTQYVCLAVVLCGLYTLLVTTYLPALTTVRAVRSVMKTRLTLTSATRMEHFALFRISRLLSAENWVANEKEIARESVDYAERLVNFVKIQYVNPSLLWAFGLVSTAKVSLNVLTPWVYNMMSISRRKAVLASSGRLYAKMYKNA